MPEDEKEKKKKSAFTASMLPKIRERGLSALHVLAGQLARFLIIVIGSAISVWLMYTMIWKPLSGEVGLPPSVPEAIPELDQRSLDKIIQYRDARVSHAVRGYSQYLEVFGASENTKIPIEVPRPN